MNIIIKVKGYQCRRCGYKWISKLNSSAPKKCPKCYSPYWNKPRQATIKRDILKKYFK